MRSVWTAAVLLVGCHADPRAGRKGQIAPTPATVAVPARADGPDSPRGVAWGEPVSGLRLGIERDEGSVVVVVRLENVGPTTLVVMSHVETHERQNDWLHVTVVDERGAARAIELSDSRDRSASVRARLEPKRQLVDRWNLAEWSLRARNGGVALAPAPAELRATYVTRAEDYVGAAIADGERAWIGTVVSGSTRGER